ncbi:cytochrome aa3 quinol oxidase subunit III, partial [Sinobaca sp. H24]|uniref:cytochrome aa3 quinol oxidase subunit III n=1 Tax=Sinobaca sp. H24 TaxID=2923376 RepID=UPI00207931A4
GRMNILGFWIFLGAEIALFATIFATYAVMIGRTADAPSTQELFSLPITLLMTFLLLTSSFTCGIAINEMRRGSKNGLLLWMGMTLVLGLGFLGLEIYEFEHLVHEGASISSAAYWSAFFTLTGTHGLHVTVGLGWGILLLIQLYQRGITPRTASKFFIFGLYWHFLDVVWIFVYTVVYLLGMVG